MSDLSKRANYDKKVSSLLKKYSIFNIPEEEITNIINQASNESVEDLNESIEKITLLLNKYLKEKISEEEFINIIISKKIVSLNYQLLLLFSILSIAYLMASITNLVNVTLPLILLISLNNSLLNLIFLTIYSSFSSILNFISKTSLYFKLQHMDCLKYHFHPLEIVYQPSDLLLGANHK